MKFWRKCTSILQVWWTDQGEASFIYMITRVLQSSTSSENKMLNKSYVCLPAACPHFCLATNFPQPTMVKPLNTEMMMIMMMARTGKWNEAFLLRYVKHLYFIRVFFIHKIMILFDNHDVIGSTLSQVDQGHDRFVSEKPAVSCLTTDHWRGEEDKKQLGGKEELPKSRVGLRACLIGGHWGFVAVQSLRGC